MKPLVTIVMPIYNGETTLLEVFDNLEKQNDKHLVDKLIMVNDNSSDNGKSIIENYKEHSSFRCKIITHTDNHGLASGYNEGIKQARTPYVITMHQDMVLSDPQSISKAIAPLDNDNVAASYPTLLHPVEVWDTYGFWQKAMFSRFVGKKIPMLTGKFDCFRKSAIEHVGLFDSRTYRTAGEDSDLKRKLALQNYELAKSNVEVIHVHNREKNFGWQKYVRKDAQIAESQGVQLRIYGPRSLKEFSLIFFRQILLISCFIPVLNFIGIPLTLAYSYAYTARLFKYHESYKQTFMLPFVNLYILVVSTVYAARGFIRVKQVL